MIKRFFHYFNWVSKQAHCLAKHLIGSVVLIGCFCSFPGFGQQAEFPDTAILIENVNIFDGKKDAIKANYHVLIVNQLIKKISDKKIPYQGDALKINGQGFTLMPGLIESHGHLAIVDSLPNLKHHYDWVDIGVRQAAMAKSWLLDGFTTIRDVGGPTMGLKRSIDAGIVPGPRIYPSGAFISQTSGHGDMRERSDRHPYLDGAIDETMQRLGYYYIADGVPQVLAATRNNLRNGATQIKIMAGGGNGSEFDPIDSLQFRPEEIKAIVNAAKDWDTYVTAHVFYPDQINRFIDAGGMSIEHAPAIDELTMKKVVNKGVFVAMQMNGLSKELRDSPFNPPYAKAGIIEIQNDSKNFVKLVKKYRPKMVFATDALGDIDTQMKQRRFELYERARIFGNFETLKSATSVGGELMQLTNRRNPYKLGKLGVVEEGAYADLLIVAGNPLADISLLGANKQWHDAQPPESIDTIKVIIKDGQIIKSRLRNGHAND
ncbi:amidohydrolase family protein [Thalassotalea litorea]|uniref:Amidohydrolase family protein n=1 Tax=Thalassotalea litorea TaxID=2020715 RepID=A0A5R9IR35_9GAMM|nr:amidohydrolase family protein [Thalassotalea litorea]TLU65686.1 amidohydrolase family protein [Thalassotalea litorea]